MTTRKAQGTEFVEAGLITQQQLNTAVDYQKSLGGTIGQIIVKLGYVADTKLTNYLSKKYGVPMVDLKSIVLPVELAKRIPWELIQKHQVVPIHNEGRTITIVTAEPLDYDAVEEIQYATSMQVEYNLAPRSHITAAIKEFAQILGRGTVSAPALTPPKTSKQDKRGSAGSLISFKDDSEDGLVEGARSHLSGRVSAGEISKVQVREAAISLLIKKGVISRAELFDAVIEVLVDKGVITDKDLRGTLK